MNRPTSLKQSPSKRRRLPPRLEIEVAKLLSTLGFSDYGTALWNICEARGAREIISPLESTIPGAATAAEFLVAQGIGQQILEQGYHDPSILAAGAPAIPFLHQVKASDLLGRVGVNVSALFGAAPERVDFALIAPDLIASGAAGYIARVVAAERAHSVLIVVTDQTESDAGERCSNKILEAFEEARVLYWRDWVSSSDEYGSRQLALFLHALDPAVILVNGSEIGLEMISRFGRPLSQFHRLFCAYFGASRERGGPLWSIRYPRRTANFAVSLTDNEGTAALLRERYGSLSGPGVVVLPAPVEPVDKKVFEARLQARRARTSSRQGPNRWLWVSPIEPSRGAAILSALAQLRPNDCFDLFGPIGPHTLESLELDQPNIVHRGVLSDARTADFSAYDAFVSTSQREETQSVVPEISQHAIPMVLAEVERAPSEFDSSAAFLVSTAGPISQAAAAFDATCDRVLTLTANEIAALAIEASKQALACHAPEVFAKNVTQRFGIDSWKERRASRGYGGTQNGLLKGISSHMQSDEASSQEATGGANGGKRKVPRAPDVTAVVVFHNERAYVIPALASLAEMVQAARESGIAVEARAILDRADEETRRLVTLHGDHLDGAEEVSFGDLGLTRNAAAKTARGDFITFLDGDDLWGAQWLKLAYRAATARDAPTLAIWHPEDAFHFHEKDFRFHLIDNAPNPHALSHHFLLQSSDSPSFDRRALLIENVWTAHAFGPRELFLRFPYRANDRSNGFGFEDWRWNLDTLENGIPHRVVPGAVHMLRVKETSLNLELASGAFLPLRD